MSKFVRGIDRQDFITALKTHEFWNAINNDPDLFVGIRNNYINAYFKGNNICKLKYQPRKKRLSGEVHYKYLGKPHRGDRLKSPYIDILREPIRDCHAFISSIKKASESYPSNEKTGVHSECMTVENLLDVEIAFSGCHLPTNGRKGTLDRLDYLKLEEQNRKLMLVFYEAKTIVNSEIRARKEPHVLEQMRGYTATLRGHAEEIVRSYNMVCANIRELELRRTGTLLNQVQNNLTPDNIDYNPRLIIFGHDRRESSSWQEHYKKLKDELGDRVFLKAQESSPLEDRNRLRQRDA